jgi:1-phosphofructokinase
VIVTVTLNPSLDRTVEIDTFDRGQVLRARSARLDPGGKGVNVARALAANDFKTRAVLPCGGRDGEALASMLAAEGVDLVALPTAAPVRSNITVIEADGTVTKINEPGGGLGPDELDACIDTVLRTAAGADWVVACGSLPPGVTDDFYARLGKHLSQAGIRFAVDTSGPALWAALAGPPALIKPNLHELAEAAGRMPSTLGEVVEAANVLREQGPVAVLASLGPDGAVLVDGDTVVHGEATVHTSRSTVGAGDALLAGFLAGGAHGAAALAEALAWGAAAVRQPGSRMPHPHDIDRSDVHVHDHIDSTRVLATRE